ncbi:hypothetical protein BGP_0510 [Beggiatoa sp. PS]|nr:hypothetical protein BGP_0510 [Beggiatoa sp. PS]
MYYAGFRDVAETYALSTNTISFRSRFVEISISNDVSAQMVGKRAARILNNTKNRTTRLPTLHQMEITPVSGR